MKSNKEYLEDLSKRIYSSLNKFSNITEPKYVTFEVKIPYHDGLDGDFIESYIENLIKDTGAYLSWSYERLDSMEDYPSKVKVTVMSDWKDRQPYYKVLKDLERNSKMELALVSLVLSGIHQCAEMVEFDSDRSYSAIVDIEDMEFCDRDITLSRVESLLKPYRNNLPVFRIEKLYDDGSPYVGDKFRIIVEGRFLRDSLNNKVRKSIK